jgi:hypothetical protein
MPKGLEYLCRHPDEPKTAFLRIIFPAGSAKTVIWWRNPNIPVENQQKIPAYATALLI